MLKKSLVEILFQAFSIQRWNDMMRPMDFIQMDKHAHKMVIAYCLGKYEESRGNHINWLDIIKGGIYELIRRIVISDIQAPVYKEIEKNKDLLYKLNMMIYEEIEPKIDNEKIRKEFRLYLEDIETYLEESSRKILEAAHKYSSYWEFQIIRDINRDAYQTEHIAMELGNDVESYRNLLGINLLKKRHKIKNFVDLTGQLRYQFRWGHLPRIPKTSVLGHSMLVAVLSYFLTMELENPCPKRIYNNFFGGIFHDLPEAITRDIIKPVKKSVPGMEEEIKRIEQKLTDEEIFPHVDKSWVPELKVFTTLEFASKINGDQSVTSEEINQHYNSDEYNPYDGEIIKAADDFSAFLEAWNSIQFGVKSIELSDAMRSVRENYKSIKVGGLKITDIYDGYSLI